MAKNISLRQVTEFVVGMGRLAFIGVIGLLLFLVLVMVGDLLLYILARATQALFELMKALFGV